MAKSEIREGKESGNTQACRVLLTGTHYQASVYFRETINNEGGSDMEGPTLRVLSISDSQPTG